MGGGHVQRCLALAEWMTGWRSVFAVRPGTEKTVPALGASGHEIFTLEGHKNDEPGELATRLDTPCQVLVVDHYERDICFETACRALAARILVLDDVPGRVHDCDILLDATPGRHVLDYVGKAPKNCMFLLGPKYALLRRQFSEARTASLARRVDGHDPERLLVCMGMTDPNNLTGIALQGVADCGLPLPVDVVLGSVAPHRDELRRLAHRLALDVQLHFDVGDMASLMSKADLAIGASGQSSLERCCLGVPSLFVIAADNQRDLADGLASAGAAESLGESNALQPDRVAAALTALTEDDARRIALGHNAAALCDGRGAARVAEHCTAKPIPTPAEPAGS